MYMPSRPKTVSVKAFKSQLVLILKTARYLVCHTLSFHEPTTGQDDIISTKNPKGKFNKTHLSFAESYLEKANTRSAAVQQKATILLATLGVLSPLLFAIVQLPERIAYHSVALNIFFISIFSFAGLFILLAFIACFRALSFYKYRDIGMGFVIQDSSVSSISTDRFVRAKLYEAAEKNTMTDHIADFVRASQMCLMLGAMLIIIGSLVAINVHLLVAEELSKETPKVIIVPVNAV